MVENEKPIPKRKNVSGTLNKNTAAQRKVQDNNIEKRANKLVQVWVPKTAVSDTISSTTNSASNSNITVSMNTVTTASSNTTANKVNRGQPRKESIWHVYSGCSRHMTDIMTHLEDFKKYDGGHVVFGDNPKGGKISGKGKVSKCQMTFDYVYYVEQLRYNLLSLSQVCDKKHKFKIVDESMILLRTPKRDNVYCLDLENVSSNSSLNCLFSKASVGESSLWHRRMCYVNLKNMNQLVKNNLVRGFPTKEFSCDDHCVACLKGKQHKSTHKSQEIKTISSPLQLLHMDLIGPTNVMSISKKSYCLVIVDDYSRFTWVFFLRTKDETSGLIKPLSHPLFSPLVSDKSKSESHQIRQWY
ncbi:hypothetical protein OSB04_031409 [Centaurea solstitialis]|uniref:GAG-pre-integrase domain-containing protein n=1 Tax=Centaurea solstitialis TaxID=347529 RepID=A0AA38SLL9_9ASTR|nr:hypothetical protein OSB04_031409 [Centaurea solstitialis]